MGLDMSIRKYKNMQNPDNKSFEEIYYYTYKEYEQNEICYWRKAYFLHSFLIDNCENSKVGDRFFLTKKDIEKAINYCKNIKEKGYKYFNLKADDIYYWIKDIKENEINNYINKTLDDSIEQLSKLLEEDWDNNCFTYDSSY